MKVSAMVIAAVLLLAAAALAQAPGFGRSGPPQAVPQQGGGAGIIIVDGTVSSQPAGQGMQRGAPGRLDKSSPKLAAEEEEDVQAHPGAPGLNVPSQQRAIESGVSGPGTAGRGVAPAGVNIEPGTDFLPGGAPGR